MIDDQFVIVFITIFNSFISTLVSGTRFLTNESVAQDAQFLGVDLVLAPSPALNMK